jgi:hypothetical protein
VEGKKEREIWLSIEEVKEGDKREWENRKAEGNFCNGNWSQTSPIVAKSSFSSPIFYPLSFFIVLVSLKRV